jgi:hypothetical protein
MRILNSLVLGTLLIAGPAYADGFGVDAGPFSLQFGVGDNGYPNNPNGGYVVEHNVVEDHPICAAITHQQQLGFVTETREILNTKELKIVTKHLVVEPYAFGITREGQPVLRGKVVEEKLLQEVTVKYGDDQLQVPEKTPKSTGWFQSSDKTNIDIQHVTNMQVLNTHFDAPKDFKGVRDDNVRIICELPLNPK